MTAFGKQSTSAPSGAHLSYFGGPVVSNVQVIQVLYGGTQSQYLPNVWNSAPPSLAAFYAGVTKSAYVDWLVEYNTPASGGTHQTIGRGSFLVQKHITPSSANDGAVISDAQIQNELAAQIMAGSLPAPATDAAGHSNTAYMIQLSERKDDYARHTPELLVRRVLRVSRIVRAQRQGHLLRRAPGHAGAVALQHELRSRRVHL